MGELENEGDALAGAWVEIGRVDDALRWAESRVAPPERFAALVAVVRALGERKPELDDHVRAILPRIEAALDGAPGPALMLAAALIRGGLVDEAERTLEAMPPGGFRSAGDGALAIARAAAGDVPRALAIARGLALEWFGPDRVPASRAEVLAEIASARFSANDAAQGTAIAEEADQARAAIQEWKQAVAGLAIVRAFARGERWDEAQRVARALPTPDGRQAAWLALIEAVSARGDIERVEQLVRAAEAGVDATDALVIGAPAAAARDVRGAIAGFMAAELRAALAAALCRAGSHARARDVVRTIPRGTRAWICANAAFGCSLAAAGARDEAIVVFDETIAALGASPVPSPDWAAVTANALAASGFGEKAQALLASHPAPARERALADAALAALEAGRRDVMRDLLAALSPDMPFARAEALRRMGGALAAAGDLDAAESLAAAIPAEISLPIQRERRYLLAVIARAAARQGDALRARDCIDRACG
jgi:hypothetical protein